MKRSKKLGILLGVLLAVCLTTAAVTGMQQKKEDIRSTESIILEIPTESVTALAWNSETAPQPLAYHRTDGQWIYDEDEAFPVDNAKIDQLLEQFQQFSAAFIIENVEDYGQYGLDDPMGTITITTDGTQYEIQLGDFSKMDAQRYLSIGDGNVYLAQHDPMEEFSAVLGQTMLHDDIPEFDQITSVVFQGEEPYQIDYLEDSGYSYRDSDVYFRGTDPLDTGRVDTYLNSLSHIILENDVSYNVTPEELTTYGLDTPELTVTVNYTEQDAEEAEAAQSVTVSISQDPTEKAVKEVELKTEEDSDAPEEITAYLRVGESPIVYKISTDEYRQVMAYGYDDLRHEQILPAEVQSITAVDAAFDNEQYHFTSEPGQDDARVWSCQDEEVSITGLENALSGMRAYSFTEEAPAGPLEVSVTLTLEGEDAPQSTIDLYRYDGEYCLATVDGRPTALIPRSQMVDVKEAVNSIVLG